MNSCTAAAPADDNDFAPTGDFAELQRRVERHSQRLSQHARELRRLRDDLDELDQRIRSA
ncbi:hypothetical protein [Kibdelosporangium phytohabitans]|uniref:Uncharacterized protein n=1 Tax=Kibdelosporangium phytohabitans TaxID=860235 RepID=A0A0N9I7Q8_9PSEU|nr:hypothetical protein [Kibdelosporangium phytohabitans]ALG12186.1 hypothetical protein AOZ06_39775 [Kibdelosporangium phytohabitans]MBE1463715.1 chromosome segregation ATPase [Kibdelosporangium phytohabitans]